MRKPEDTQKIVDALTKAYAAMDMGQRPQLLVAMRHMYAAELMPFLFNVAKTKVTEYGGDAARLYAFQSYALLANKAEMAQAKALFDKDALFKEQLSDHLPLFAAANACDAERRLLDIGKLKDGDEDPVLRKAVQHAGAFRARQRQGDSRAGIALRASRSRSSQRSVERGGLDGREGQQRGGRQDRRARSGRGRPFDLEQLQAGSAADALAPAAAGCELGRAEQACAGPPGVTG